MLKLLPQNTQSVKAIQSVAPRPAQRWLKAALSEAVLHAASSNVLVSGAGKVNAWRGGRHEQKCPEAMPCGLILGKER